MDLRAYYKKIREVENTINAPFVVVVSSETADGGRGGMSIEVSKGVASKLLAEGRARLASDEEAKLHYECQAEARREAEAAAAAQRMQVMLVSSSDVRAARPKVAKE